MQHSWARTNERIRWNIVASRQTLSVGNASFLRNAAFGNTDCGQFIIVPIPIIEKWEVNSTKPRHTLTPCKWKVCKSHWNASLEVSLMTRSISHCRSKDIPPSHHNSITCHETHVSTQNYDQLQSHIVFTHYTPNRILLTRYASNH